MTDAEGRARVVFGAQATETGVYRMRGMGRWARSYVDAVQAGHGDRVVQVDAAPDAYPTPDRVPTGEGLVYHVLSPFQPWPLGEIWPRWARAHDVALAVTLFDLIPLRHPDRYMTQKPEAQQIYLQRFALVQQADAVLAISEAVAHDAVSMLGIDERRVFNVGSAMPDQADVAPGDLPPGARRDSILYVSGGDWRKNNELLVDAYAALSPALRAAHQLVLVGDMGPMRSFVAARVMAHGIEGEVLLTDEISEAELAALRDSCTLAVAPSLDEGFGLPVLEALHAGLPTLVSDIPPFREILPDPAARFDPRSAASVAAALERGLTDHAFRDDLRARAAGWAAPFRWSDVADRGVAAYDAAVARRARRLAYHPPAVRDRPAVSIVTPWPPRRTGVAQYSERLVAALEPLADVDVYADQLEAGSAPGDRPVVAASEFGWRRELARPSLVTLFCLGDSPFHVDAWVNLMHHGGDVLLHDATLSSLYEALWRAGALGVEGLRNAMRRVEGRTLDDLRAPDVTLVGEVVDRARRVYVHTEAARQRVLGARPLREQDVQVVPFAMPAPRVTRREADHPLIVSFGYVQDGDLTLDAVTPLLRHNRDARMVFAGTEWRVGDLERLAGIAAARGIGEQVSLPGWVDTDRYDELLATATVALQLRWTHRGERSASAADCIAAGVPTIVNDRSGSDSIPDDAVVRLPARPSAEATTAAVRELLRNGERRAALSLAARRFAQANGFDRAATVLLERMSAP
jgi:glycosyltransferase involved in cell wall biosynthesis